MGKNEEKGLLIFNRLIAADYSSILRVLRRKKAGGEYGAHSAVAEALDMLNQKLRIDGDELEFKKSYVAKFKQVLPGRKVVRFYQTENKFDTAATAELYRIIPVIQ